MHAGKYDTNSDGLDALHRFPVINEPLRPRMDILRRLCKMVGATSAFSVLLEDDFSTVSPVAVGLQRHKLIELDPIVTMGGMNALSRENPMTGPLMKRFVGGMMHPLAVARRELVDDSAWYASGYVSRNRLARGVDDCVISLIDLPGRKPFIELVCLNRPVGDAPAFTERDSKDVSTAHLTYSAIDRIDPDTFLPEGLEVHGRSATQSLHGSDKTQTVLEHILKGQTEDQLCISVGINRANLDQYLKTLFSEFHVKSVAELAARWGKRRKLSN